MIAARFGYPQFIERAKTQSVTVEVWDGSSWAAVTAATYTLIKPDGTKAVDAATATPGASGVVSYELNATAIPATEAYSTRWREQWDVTVDGTVYTLRRDAHLIPLALYPTATTADIERRYTKLRHKYPDGRDSWQHVIDEAWEQIVGRLISDGKQPSRIITPWSLKAPHAELALCLAWRETSVYNPGGRFDELAQAHCDRFEELWAALVFEYDTDDDGDADEQESAHGPVLATAGRKRGYWPRRKY